MAYDLLIKNARVIDGSGMPGYAADVAVQEIAREREVRGAVGMDQRGAGDAGEPHHEADGERGEQGGIDA